MVVKTLKILQIFVRRPHTHQHSLRKHLSVSQRDVFAVNCLPKTKEICSVYRHTIRYITEQRKEIIELNL